MLRIYILWILFNHKQSRFFNLEPINKDKKLENYIAAL